MENKKYISKEKDIFDRIMEMPIFNIFEPFYKKHKEGLLYLFFGGLSFLISILSYAILSELFYIDILVSNIFAWIFSVSFAYITNRIWVFDVKATEVGEIAKEIGRFVSGRIATLLVEEVMLLILIEWLEFDSMRVKIITSVVVILWNYFISKCWVFNV